MVVVVEEWVGSCGRWLMGRNLGIYYHYRVHLPRYDFVRSKRENVTSLRRYYLKLQSHGLPLETVGMSMRLGFPWAMDIDRLIQVMIHYRVNPIDYRKAQDVLREGILDYQDHAVVVVWYWCLQWKIHVLSHARVVVSVSLEVPDFQLYRQMRHRDLIHRVW